MMNLISRLMKEEEGQGMVEYALLIALIAVVVMVTLGTLGEKINLKFQSVTTELSN